MMRRQLPILSSLFVATAPLLAQNVWFDRNVTSPAVCGQRLVYDAARDDLLLIGTQVCNQMMAWDGTAWTARSSATSPPSRPFEVCYDDARQVVVAVLETSASMVRPSQGRGQGRRRGRRRP